MLGLPITPGQLAKIVGTMASGPAGGIAASGGGGIGGALGTIGGAQAGLSAAGASANAGGGSGIGAAGAMGIASAASGMTSSLLTAIFQGLEAHRQASLGRDISKSLRREAVPWLRRLTGLVERPGKGGVVGGEAEPAVLAAQQMLRSPRTYSEQEIRSMQAARRLMSPRFRALAGPATGATLARALPAPSNVWETVVQPRMEAEAANALLGMRGAGAASAFRNLRFKLGTQYVK